MKLSKRTIDDLLTLVEHARTDISFLEGGSYNVEKNGDYPFDERAAKKAERAINFIKALIINRE